MKIQYSKNITNKFIKDEITLACLMKDPSVIKIEERDARFEVLYKDGTTSIALKLVNGKCAHPFAVMGQGYDGKFYYACDTGGCDYKRELSEEEIEKFIKAPEREANQ